MHGLRSPVTPRFLSVLLASWALLWAAPPVKGQSGQLPMEPLHSSGENVTAAYEGWFKNPDGSSVCCLGTSIGIFKKSWTSRLAIITGLNGSPRPGPADAFSASKAMGPFHRYGTREFRDPEAHLDDRRQRPGHRGPRAPGCPVGDRALLRCGHWQHAAAHQL